MNARQRRPAWGVQTIVAMGELICEWANEEGRVKRKQECTEPATERVRNVLGINYYCKRHAWLVRANEEDWNRAEAEEFA